MKKVAIVGRAPGWKQAPFNDPTFEIWSFNNLYRIIGRVPGGRWTRWLEVHEKKLRQKERREVLAGLNCPVYLLEEDLQKYNDIPNAVRFPFQEIVDRFFCRINRKWFFTSSMAYFLALAAYEEFDVVHLYGINQATRTEYDYQRPCTSFWLGVLAGRGAEIYVQPQSQLLNPETLYGRPGDGR